MLLNFTILLLFTFISGLIVFIYPKLDKKAYKILLSFSGAYLFSITMIHILPELFSESKNIQWAGVFVLIGFFLQMVLVFFSGGVEHGHIHIHDHHHDHEEHHHHHHTLPVGIMIALCIHSLLEGSLLVHPFHQHDHEGAHGLLFGLILHKIPEAVALMAILLHQLPKKRFALTLLFIYSLMSPLGLFLSDLTHTHALVNEDIFQILFALVAGNFLYISTTIFFEAVPDHKFRANKIVVFIIAAIVACIVEIGF